MTPRDAGLVPLERVQMPNWRITSVARSKRRASTARATESYGRGFELPAFAPVPGAYGE